MIAGKLRYRRAYGSSPVPESTSSSKSEICCPTAIADAGVSRGLDGVYAELSETVPQTLAVDMLDTRFVCTRRHCGVAADGQFSELKLLLPGENGGVPQGLPIDAVPTDNDLSEDASVDPKLRARFCGDDASKQLARFSTDSYSCPQGDENCESAVLFQKKDGSGSNLELVLRLFCMSRVP